jgi:hypothetical protein
MRRAIQSLGVSLLMIVTASSAIAQQCTPDDTLLICWRKYNSVAAKTAQSIATTNTGTPSATTQAAATALRDFQSFFSAGFDAGTVVENATSVTLDWNIPFPFVENDDRVKVQTFFTDPSLAADVATPLGSNSPAAKSQLTNFDDVATLISYAPVNQYFGRSIAPHIDFLRYLETAANSDPTAELQKLAQLLTDVPQTILGGSKFSEISDPAEQAAVMAQVEAAALAEEKSATRATAIVKALTKVINNQPQAYAGGTYHYRNALAGPDEMSVKGTFELSPKSLNRFLKSNDSVCDPAKNTTSGKVNAASAARCVSRLVAFSDAASQANAGDRLAFSIEYKRASAESVNLSKFKVVPPNTPVVRPETKSFIYSLTYGHPLTGAKIKDARFDLAINYWNISNDPTKKDRFVASLTFSQKVSETMTLPLSITYANHTQYVPQTDRRVGINFGVSYKIPNSGGGQY